MAARNMQRIEINIYEKRIMRQVGYLQRLYRDAWSTERKILGLMLLPVFYRLTVLLCLMLVPLLLVLLT